MKKAILTSVLFSLFLIYLSAGATNDKIPKNDENTNFQGKVIDKQTGESLVGVVIEIDGTNIKAYSDLDGNYTINGLKDGKYTLTINYISYRKDIRVIEVKAKENKNINFLLEPVKN
jgi:hypothetical protein